MLSGRLPMLVVVSLVLILPAGARAQDYLPPDNSGLDEYVESLPYDGGNKPARTPHAGARPTGLPASVVRRLRSSPDGRVLSRLAADAGGGSSHRTRAGGQPRGAAGGAGPGGVGGDAGGKGLVATVADVFFGGAGAGAAAVASVALLIGLAGLGAGFVRLRRRSR